MSDLPPLPEPTSPELGADEFPPLPDPAATTRATRAEPRLIRIRPRLTHSRDILGMAVLPGLGLALMGWALVELDVPHVGKSGPSKMIYAAWGLAGCGAVLALIVGGLAWFLNRKRANFLRHCAELEQASESGAATFDRSFDRDDRRPQTDILREITLEYLSGNHPRSWIVCVGMVDVPPIDPMPFEPEIISPNRLIWDYAAIISAVLLACVLLTLLIPFIVNRPPFSLAEHAIVLLFALMIGGAAIFNWFYRAVWKPTYLRLAPGIIQSLEYGLRRSRPLIRSYPISGGTLAIVSNQFFWDLNLTLIRDGKSERIPLSGIRKSGAVASRVWQSLLSPAITPPLDNEQLLG